MIKVIQYTETVAGADIAILHNKTINEYRVQINSLQMLVVDWEQLQSKINELLLVAGYVAKSPEEAL